MRLLVAVAPRILPTPVSAAYATASVCRTIAIPIAVFTTSACATNATTMPGAAVTLAAAAIHAIVTVAILDRRLADEPTK